jgi:DNA-binding GntR family transcriptional regulator
MTSTTTPQGPERPTAVWYRTTQKTVVEHLRGQILRGTMAPGTRLLQAELAAELQISTTPVREALRQLVAEGLLDGDAHRGVVVHQASREELEDIYEIRMALEPLAIASTVKRVTDEELRQVESIVEEMDSADAERFVELNVLFHKLLADAAGRPRLAAILTNLRELSTFYVAQELRADSGRAQISIHIADHRRLLAACKAHDGPAAKRIQREHLIHTLDAGLAYLDGAEA